MDQTNPSRLRKNPSRAARLTIPAAGHRHGARHRGPLNLNPD